MKFSYMERQLEAMETKSFTTELNSTTNALSEQTILFNVAQSRCLCVTLGKLYYPFEEKVLKSVV